MPALGNANTIPTVATLGEGEQVIVPTPIVEYLFDGNDGFTPVTVVPSYRIGPECSEAISTYLDLTGSLNNDVASAQWATIGTGPFTVKLWFNTLAVNPSNSAVVSTQALFATDDGLLGDGGWEWIIQGGQLKILWEGNVYETGIAEEYNQGQWHEIYCMSSGANGTLKVYIDGVLTAIDTTAPNYNFIDTGDFVFGANKNGGARPFVGRLDGFKLWNSELTTEERVEDAQRCDYQPLLGTNTTGYFDSQDQTTITQGGKLVSLWEEQVAGECNLGQTVSTSRPMTLSNFINGINGIRGGNTYDDFLECVNFTVASSQSFVISFVAQNFAVFENLGSYVSFNGDNNRDMLFFSGTNPDWRGNIRLVNPVENALQSGGPYNGPHIWQLVFDWDSSTMQIRRDGVITASATYDTTPIGGPGIFRVLQKEVPAATSSPDGILVDMIISNAVVEEEIEANCGQLAWKCGLTGNLDVSFPYKDVPPKLEAVWVDGEEWIDAEEWND